METSDPTCLERELAEGKRQTKARQRTEPQRDAQRTHPQGPRGLTWTYGGEASQSTLEPSREKVPPAARIAYTNASGRRTEEDEEEKKWTWEF